MEINNMHYRPGLPISGKLVYIITNPVLTITGLTHFPSLVLPNEKGYQFCAVLWRNLLFLQLYTFL